MLILSRISRLRTTPRSISPTWVAVAAMLVAVSGCVRPIAVTQPAAPPVYTSSDYIVLRLDADESASHLAGRFLGDSGKAWMIAEANPGARFRGGEQVVIPLKRPNKAGVYADGYQTVPILTYHRFSDDCQSPLCTPTAAFKQQMRYLKENGYHALTPEELLAFLEYRQPLPKQSVLITIDDGYRSVYDIAYPILRENGFTATLFIYTELIDVAPIALTWNQLMEMKQGGFAIGSHTITHSDLTLPREGESKADYAARVEKELTGSKQIIDRRLGQDTWMLAYPYGNYDQKIVAASKQTGYKLAMSVKRGGNPFFANALTLKRDQILERDMATFTKRLKTFNPIPLK
ncbi:MAG: polysaccharide deacetylase family protein [Deltaproteobacteria bacterium]|nr:polysaccharide deacetylase family protein [Deltaproteobacteria bacterium]